MSRREHSQIFCPECGIEQAWKDISFMSWFLCRSCGAYLRVPERRAQRLWWIGMAVALALLGITRPGLGLSLLLWFPLGVGIGILLSVVLLGLSPPRLESDLPRNPPPGSPLGLNR